MKQPSLNEMGITSIQETKQGWLKSWCRSYPTTSHLKWFLQQFSAIFWVLLLWVIVDMVEGGVDTELDRTEISVFNVSFPTTLISQLGVWEME